MTFGNNMRFRRALLLIALICPGELAQGLPSATAQPASVAGLDWGLPQLMHSLTEVKSASAQFTETKTMHMLNAPLVVSGTLDYVAPDMMKKTTLLPSPEVFALKGNEVTIVGGTNNKTQTFSLTDEPQIGGLAQGILATLAGDLPTLDRLFTLRFSGGPADWQLLLKPRSVELAKFISWIVVLGNQNHIEAINTESSDGDYSEMSITEHITDAR